MKLRRLQVREQPLIQRLFGLAPPPGEQAPGKRLCRSPPGSGAGLSPRPGAGRCGRPAPPAPSAGAATRSGRSASQAVAAPRLARRSTPCSTSVCTISSMKKGLPSVFARMSCLRGCTSRASSPSSAVSSSSRLLRPQRIEPQLGVIGLAAPGVLILGAVIHQQQEARGGDPLAQQRQPGLGLAVQPVQVFTEQEQRAG